MNRAGKGWARGKTAATDRRVARSAASHRGMTYTRRIPVELDRRFLVRAGDPARRTLALEWSPVMAYVVGLMATDGCLLSKRKQLNFKSEDEQLVRTFLQCLGRPPRYRPIRGRTGNLHYVTQFGDAEFYRWLQSVGLMPRKSLVLGALGVPDELLLHCARGLLDGDGSITNYWYDGTGKAAGKRYEGLRTRFVSGSRPHLEWLRGSFHREVAVVGSIGRGTRCWTLNYAIRESLILLPRIYPSSEVPKLERKWLAWRGYATRHHVPATASELAERRGVYRIAA